MRAALALIAPLAACWGDPVPQSPQCAAYVRCVQALDLRTGGDTDVERYVVDGACWGNPELGYGCTRSCERGLEWLRAHEPAPPPECVP